MSGEVTGLLVPLTGSQGSKPVNLLGIRVTARVRRARPVPEVAAAEAEVAAVAAEPQPAEAEVVVAAAAEAAAVHGGHQAAGRT